MQYMKSLARFPSAVATWIFWIIFECKIIFRGQEEKGTTEDEMVGWHHRIDGHGFGWAPGAVMDREAWRAVIHGVAKSWTCLSD